MYVTHVCNGCVPSLRREVWTQPMLQLPAYPVRSMLPPLLLLLPALAAGADLEVGFCDSGGNGFYADQPADQLERWELP